jgi:hypothetical protein
METGRKITGFNIQVANSADQMVKFLNIYKKIEE